MTEARLARPTLATVISIYEIILFAFAAFGYVTLLALHATHAGLTAHITMLQTVGGILSALFSLAGGIYLWLMQRAGAKMLAGKVVIDIIVYILILTQPATVPAAHAVGLVTGLLGLILNAAIAWYAYKVTPSTAPAATA